MLVGGERRGAGVLRGGEPALDIAGEFVEAAAAAREAVLGERHEAAGVLQVQQLADADRVVVDLDQVAGVLAMLAAKAKRPRRPVYSRVIGRSLQYFVVQCFVVPRTSCGLPYRSASYAFLW